MRERINLAAYDLLVSRGPIGLTMRTPLLREKLPKGLEDSVTATIVSLAGGDRGKARAIWGRVHGMVDLELAVIPLFRGHVLRT